MEMDIRISQRLNNILCYAKEEAMRTGSYAISVDHLTLGILRDGDNAACRALTDLGIDTGELKEFIDSQVFCNRNIPFGDESRLSVSRGAENAINLAAMEALKAGKTEIEAEHLLIAISRTSGNVGQAFLKECGVTPEAIINSIPDSLPETGPEEKPKPRSVTHIIIGSPSKIYS